MTEFERLYNEKKGTVEDCLKAIHSYSLGPAFAGDGNQPNVILSNLHKIAPYVQEVHCIKGHAGNFQCVTDPAMNGHISFTTFLYGAGDDGGADPAERLLCACGYLRLRQLYGGISPQKYFCGLCQPHG